MPPPGVKRLPGRNDCAAFSPAAAKVDTHGPFDHDRVIASATIHTVNLMCGTAQAPVTIQTKVCGFWGCEWKEKATTPWINLLPNAVVDSQHISTPLRKGVNTYRVRVELKMPELDTENGIPYVTSKGSDIDGRGIQLGIG